MFSSSTPLFADTFLLHSTNIRASERFKTSQKKVKLKAHDNFTCIAHSSTPSTLSSFSTAALRKSIPLAASIAILLWSNPVSLFESIENEAVEPDDITFLGVRSACAHAWLIDKGQSFFDSMVKEHGIAPKLEHYCCMVDLLGRGGCVIEAHELIKRMSIPPDARIWGALLGACRTHGYLELAKHAAGHLLKLEPWNAGNYVLLSHVYAARGQWDDVEQVWEKMRGRLVQKTPGSSAIEVESYIHEFVTGDRLQRR